MDRDAAAGHGVGQLPLRAFERAAAAHQHDGRAVGDERVRARRADAAAPPVTSAVRPARGAEVRIVQPSSGRS